MPEYVVEDRNTEAQVDDFEAENIDEALKRVCDDFAGFFNIPSSMLVIEKVDEYHGFIGIKIPYAERPYPFEVGEVGR
ncbi:MAG TPA: hypothetical protein VN455_05625 [Methanotrichaceae archaeon]|nr:hypothetical protein [Methanotrichaceae archaeon]